LADACALVGEVEEEIGIHFPEAGRRFATVFGNRLPSSKEIIGKLPAVCFSSIDMQLISGEPSVRRRFFDTELSLISAGYLKESSAYKRSLEQRNATLRAIREGTSSAAELEPWTQQMARSGAAIRRLRAEFLAALVPLGQARHLELSRLAEQLSLREVRSDDARTEAELAEVWLAKIPADVSAGMTTVGPHRDDFAIDIDGRYAKSFGSLGQQRTAVLSIKLAITAYWRDTLGQLPVLLLDDIMSDLDVDRRAMVLAASSGLGQVLITATGLDQIPSEVRSEAKGFLVSGGEITDI
jgi:DNA replication and repair protein RecF